jgi:hypothetical protein
LFGEDGADQADDGGAVGEDADDVGAATDLLGDARASCYPYERRWMPAVTPDRLDAGGVRAGEYGATVRDGCVRAPLPGSALTGS